MDARKVQENMNRCGKQGTPFLFGVDFEMKEGFFVENPLKDQNILFVAGKINNIGPLSPPTYSIPELEILSTAPSRYMDKFAIVQAGLLRGDSFLLNLTEKTPIYTNLSLKQIFYYSQARYKVYFPDRFVCFSPESFIQIIDNQILSYPMKGTINAALPNAETLLRENYKEECEHYTIVDLIRNDLNQIANKVQVKRFRYVEKISTLHGDILQTSSEIIGQLASDWQKKIGNLIFKLLPAGSISGAPKSATVRLIQQAEDTPRGYYTGVFGYFDGHNLDSAVMIRYIEKEADQYFFRSGGGITINSQATEEYTEVLEKIYLPIIHQSHE